jgi:hypothetical protein
MQHTTPTQADHHPDVYGSLCPPPQRRKRVARPAGHPIGRTAPCTAGCGARVALIAGKSGACGNCRRHRGIRP